MPDYSIARVFLFLSSAYQ